MQKGQFKHYNQIEETIGYNKRNRRESEFYYRIIDLQKS